MPAEAETLAAFLTWAQDSGFNRLPPEDLEDAVVEDQHGTVIVEAKGATSSPGTDIDTLYGQLLRRMRPSHPASTRYAAVVPATCLDAALRVPESIRTQLRIDVYSVKENGVIDTRWAAPRK